jgi:predicted dehydrogenase
MKFTINDIDTNVDGTSYKGSIVTDYKTLVRFFGDPNPGSADGKTTCEWVLEFEDGTVATIHDWKSGSVPTEKYKWSIGGRESRAVEYIEQITNIKTDTFKF